MPPAQNGASGATTLSSEQCIALENEYGARNYHPLPCVFDRGQGARVYDPEQREYIDFLSAYSAVNQGHAHPRIVKALTDQAQKLTLSSRAFHASGLGEYAEKITKLLGFESVLPMNTGAEAVETAMKLARKWAYKVKGVPADKAMILSVTENFHGRTIGIISMSTDPDARNDFGPYLPNVGPICAVNGEQRRIGFGHAEDLEAALEAHGQHVAAFLVEPIQGEAGIVVPPEDYLRRCQALCRKHNVLLIIDEIQTGLGRTGRMTAYSHDPEVKPDIVTLGKALSGGVYPVSAVLSSKAIMHQIRPGEHGSTYGGNPLACAVACAALDVIVDEQLCERAERLGKLLLKDLEELKSNSDGWIIEVRGKGLFAAIVLDETKSKKGRGAWQLCLLLKHHGVLAKPTHVNIIRLAPPLVISESDLRKGVEVIKRSLAELDTLDTIPGEEGHPEEQHHKAVLDD